MTLDDILTLVAILLLALGIGLHLHAVGEYISMWIVAGKMLVG